MRNLTNLVALMCVALAIVACKGNEDSLDEAIVNLGIYAPDCAEEGNTCPTAIQFCLIAEDDERVNGFEPDSADEACSGISLDADGRATASISVDKAGNYLPMWNGSHELPEGLTELSMALNGVPVANKMQIERFDNDLQIGFNVVANAIGDEVADEVVDEINNRTGGFELSAELADGTAVSACSWDFHWDELDSACTKTQSGVTCADVPVDNYEVDVTCQNGTLSYEGYQFSVQADTVSTYTVVVAPVTTDVVIPATGSVTFVVTDSDGETPADECTADYNADTLDEACEGLSCTDVPSGSYTVTITCGDLINEDFPFDVVSGDDVTYDVTVEEPGSDDPVVNPDDIIDGLTLGNILISVEDAEDNALTGCTFDLALGDDNPEPNTDGQDPGDYLLEDLEPGKYTMDVVCGELTGRRPIYITAARTNHVFITMFSMDIFPEEGELYMGLQGIPLDPDAPSFDLASVTCYVTADNDCQELTSEELSALTVTVEGDDPNLSSEGLVFSYDFTSFENEEREIFYIDFSISDDTSAWDNFFHIDTVNILENEDL